MDTLYIDDQIIAINKPAGLATLPGGWQKDNSSEENLLHILEMEYGKLWVVHRLDKTTSGVIMYARNRDSHRILSQMFESHFISRQYHAICNGVPNWDEHTARHRLRINVGHKHRTIVDHAHGITAVTHFRVLKRFQSNTLVEARTETGRTHQVRAHAFALGHPILADTLYGAPSSEIISRPAFHAVAIKFVLSKKPYHITAPYPPDMRIAIRKIKAGP